ncbi:hypothetical protein VTG60DRAFT_3486 [Thermothelomyces hinnuleus]
MEGRTHSFRLPLPIPRRPTHQRTASTSSEASHASTASHRSNDSEEQFILSPAHTPAYEDAPPRAMVSWFATDPSAARNDLLLGKGTLPALLLSPPAVLRHPYPFPSGMRLGGHVSLAAFFCRLPMQTTAGQEQEIPETSVSLKPALESHINPRKAILYGLLRIPYRACCGTCSGRPRTAHSG